MNCTGCDNQTGDLHADVPLCATCRSRARVAELERELNAAHAALDALDVMRTGPISGKTKSLVERINLLGSLTETMQWEREQLLAVALK
jgi:hypothetical protein